MLVFYMNGTRRYSGAVLENYDEGEGIEHLWWRDYGVTTHDVVGFAGIKTL